MIFNTEPIKHWFGFTRRERRATITLLIIIVLILALRYSFPESRAKIEDVTDSVLISIANSESSGNNSCSANSDIPSKKPNQGYIKKVYNSGNKKITYSKAVYQPSKTGLYQQKVKIDINRSDSSSLVMLPGIGPVLSSRIIKYRHLIGGFVTIDQLKEVYGLTEETFEIIKDRVSADSSLIIKTNINSADYKGLSHIRYLEKYEISSILKFRQLKGRINSISDLTVNKLISTEKAAKVGPYLRFN
jgi:competence ComEA-like helix-hairpin-helix protein